MSIAGITNWRIIQHYLQTSNRESMLHLGILLRQGKTLAEATQQVSRTARSRRIKTAAALAARRLASGESSEQVFSGRDMSAFPSRVRYILAAPIADRTRGQLIAEWNLLEKSEFSLETALYYPIVTLMVGMMTALALYMFVIPQMREIFLGLQLELTPFVALVMDLSQIANSWISMLVVFAVFGIALQLVIFASRRLTGFSKRIDEVNLLRMLAVLPVAERVRIAEMMAVKHNFPVMHDRLRSMFRAVAAGVEVEKACQKAGISDLLAWFIALALHESSSDSTLLDNASNYLYSGITAAASRTATMIEVVSTLFLASLFGGIVYAVFQMLMIITQGIYA